MAESIKTKHQFVLTDDYIAEAQRVAIAQNKTLKLVYQTWWVWWLPRFLLPLVAVFMYMNHNNLTTALVSVVLIFSFIAMIWLPDQALIEGTAAHVRQLLAANVKKAVSTSTA